MNSLMRLLFVLVFLAVPTLASAAEYYACNCASGADAQCVAGNDSAAGTSPAKAWASYERVRSAFGGLAPGDRIRFCRGGAFPIGENAHWVNSQCTANQRCSVGAYIPTWASGDEGRPLLLQTNGHGIAFEDGGDPDLEHGYVFSDLDIRCSACDRQDFGVFFYNNIDDVRLERLHVAGFGVGVHVGASNGCGNLPPGCDRDNDRISLLDSEIVDNLAFGVLASTDELVISGNRILRNGSGSGLDHNVYIGDSTHAVTRDIRVVGNTLYRSAARDSGNCEGVSLVVHGRHNDMKIEGNLIYEDVGHAAQGCWGISVDAGYTSDEAFRRVTIRGNTIRNMGNASIALSSCEDCKVENNVIVQQQSIAATGIIAPTNSPDPTDLKMQRLIVRNNSIYMTAGGSVGILVDKEGTGHQIFSNAIQSTATGGTWSCFSLGLLASAYTVDNNVCGYVTATDHKWEHGADTLAAWRTASGHDMHSKASAPGFRSPGTPSYDLYAAGSTAAMVNAGHASASAPTEFYGQDRVTSPDAGAYEFGVGAMIFVNGFEP